ncbi:MAG: folate-binding protein, partial [Proteobacteria bacterium]|nr:folate-binding protein [Pseudomonadota bacterium]
RKGLVRVGIKGAASVGTTITSGGKPAGVIYTQSGGKAIAYLRFDRAKADLMAADAVLSLL